MIDSKIIITNDGSNSIEVPSLKVTYHSRHGAIRESMHVYIDAGLKYWLEKNPQLPCHVFEMGFGTGLNALLTMMEAERLQRKIIYTTVEKYPVAASLIDQLNYGNSGLHNCEWEKEISISPFFTIKKINVSLFDFSSPQPFNLIYYDAFAPNAQPELWTAAIFQKLYEMLLPGGALVTYCSKGDVQRAMKASGFSVEKLAGPPGKREMVRAGKGDGILNKEHGISNIE